MSDDLSLIVRIGADTTGLASGVENARKMLAAFSTESSNIMRTTSAKAVADVEMATARIQTAIARIYGGGSGGGGGGRATVSSGPRFMLPAGEMAQAERQVKRVVNEARNIQTAAQEGTREFTKMRDVTSAIAKGVAGLNLAMYSGNVAIALIKGNFDEIDEVVTSLPFGLGRAAEAMQKMLEYALGINHALFSEAEGEKRRSFEERRTILARELRVANEIAAIREKMAGTDDARRRAELDWEATQKRMHSDASAARPGMLEQGLDENQIFVAFRSQWNAARAEYQKQIRDIEARELDERIKANAEAAKLIENTRRNERKKNYQEAIDEIARENDARKDAIEKAREELDASRPASPDDFITRSGTALGAFSTGQSNGSAAIAAATQKQVDLQTQIRDLTKEIRDGQKAIQTIGAWQ